MREDDGDTIRSMRLLALVVLAACNAAPTLSVVVVHPDGLAVATTEVTVYESQTLTCTDVEFGVIPDDELVALITGDETLEPGGAVTGTLDGISRTNNKVIVARGFDTTGALVSANCVQETTISGNETVTIDTVVAASVAIQPQDTISAATMVTTIDPSGALIDGRAISWTVYGPAGSVPASTTLATVDSDGVWDATSSTCTSMGSAQVHVVPPGGVDGYAVQMRVAWSTAPAPLFTNLTNASFTGMQLPTPPATVTRPCAIRHSGTTQHLVCVDGTYTATDYAVTVSNGAASLAAASTQAAPSTTIALVSIPNNGDLGVYAVDSNGNLNALFGAPAPTNKGTVCLAAGCVDDAMVVPACGDIAGKVVLHATGDLRIVDYSGNYALGSGNPFAATTSKPFDAGCVTQLDSMGSASQIQSIAAYDVLTSVTSLTLFACSTTGCAPDVTGLSTATTKGTTVGFIGGSEPRLIAVSVDATGVVLIELIISSSGNVIERSRMPAAALPERIVSGQFDTDGEPDLVWDVGTAKGTSFEVSYARQVDDEPLEALSPASSANVDNNNILVGDLTNDGIDDLVVLGSGAGTVGAAIVPMGMPMTTAVTADTPCSP
jgi:hypothetical protein